MDVILAAYTLEKARAALDFCDRLMPVLGDGRRLVVLNEPQLRGAILSTGSGARAAYPPA
jgi:hypothetical protein